jgi:hypothetical protein
VQGTSRAARNGGHRESTAMEAQELGHCVRRPTLRRSAPDCTTFRSPSMWRAVLED